MFAIERGILPEDLQINIYRINHRRQHRKSIKLINNICYNYYEDQSFRDNQTDIKPYELEQFGESLSNYKKIEIQPLAYFAHVKQLHYDVVRYCGPMCRHAPEYGQDVLFVHKMKWVDGSLILIESQKFKNNRVDRATRVLRPLECCCIESDSESDCD